MAALSVDLEAWGMQPRSKGQLVTSWLCQDTKMC